jgi:ATP:corrinoid adenosyltransferase
MSNNNALVKLPGSPTNSLTSSITAKAGVLMIVFGNGSGKATTAATGAVLQNATSGGRLFMGKTNAGSVIFQP